MPSCLSSRRLWCAAFLLSALLTCEAVTAVASGEALAKVGPELRVLYESYLAARTSGRPLVVPDPSLQIVEDRVVVDAVASAAVGDLEAGLIALGMRGTVTAGRIVSGQIPIAQIPAMAALPSSHLRPCGPRDDPGWYRSPLNGAVDRAVVSVRASLGGREGDTVMRVRVGWMVLGLLLVSGTGLAAADGVKPATRISQDLADLLSPRAAALSVETDEGVIESPVTPIPDVVTIDAVASGDPAALEAELIALGAQDTAIAGRMVSARIPLAAIPYLDGVVSLQFARAAQAVTNVGVVTSQGDKVMRADIARGLYGVDGLGVLVGVLSDSYNCLFGASVDMATGDLPPSVMVVQESTCGQGARSDEGRAMLQIVHDVAPGASLAFATAFGGQAGFANNILALRDAGAKVIVDDVGYFAAPMFQDGVIAQAVDNVKASGVAYFSSAGNQARHAYEHAFVPGQVFAPGAFGGSSPSSVVPPTTSATPPCSASRFPPARASRWRCSGIPRSSR